MSLTWTTFDDGNENEGIEGKYCITNGKLIIYVNPTNSREDWLSNFDALPSYSEKLKLWCHHGYKEYAEWLYDFIKKIIIISVKKIYLIGYSMGGGIVQIVGNKFDCKVISIDGPRTTYKIPDGMTLYYKKGGIVNRLPFWFKRCNITICANSKWQPIWEAHLWTNAEIAEIIDTQLNK